MTNLLSRKIITIDVGIKNLAIGVLSYTYNPTPPHSWKSLVFESWELVDILSDNNPNAKFTNAKTINIHKACTKMLEALARRVDLLDGVTDILVEQQPLKRFESADGKGSSRMKVLQHIILCYYECYFMFHPDLPKPTINSSSPQNKLKCSLNIENFGEVPIKTEKIEYKQRKAMAVEMCKQVMELCTVPETLQKTLEEHKRKADDLADCVMQGVYYLQSKTPKVKKSRKKKDAVVKTPRKKTVRKSIQLEEDATSPLPSPPTKKQKTN